MGQLTDYVPHDAQLVIHASDRRFRIIVTGRRFGKTLCLAADIINRAHNFGGNYGWLCPSYLTGEHGLQAIRDIAGSFVDIGGRAPAVAKVPTVDGGTAKIWFLSADNPDSIRGYGFDGIVVDEAASIPTDVWTYAIRPTIAQTMGWAVLMSTPKGRNWFFDMFTKGRDKSEPDYASFRFRSIDNPTFPMEEWEEAQRSLPADVFRQEYMGDFLADSAGVFHDPESCIVEQAGKRMGDVVVGCDLAKHQDHTVLIAMDRTSGDCLEMERFNHLDWPIQKERIIAFYRRWPGLLVMDATGAGDPIYDDLKLSIPRILPFKFSNQSKAHLIQRLIVAIEQKQITWPRAWETLTDELKRYEYDITANGAITYNAPGGYHDDCVVSLALANSERHQYKPQHDFNIFTAPRKAGNIVTAGTRTLRF